MAAVAIAGWIAFNCRLFDDVVRRGAQPPAPGEGGRMFFFSMMAWVMGSCAGCAVFAGFWRRAPKARRSVVRGLIAGAWAGFCGWGLATMIICIGERADGQSAIVGGVMGAVGATINFLPGALLGLAYGWLKRRKGTQAIAEPPPDQWSPDPDAVE